jgi:nucleoside-diphosphate-sugar epimerase
LTRKAVVVGAGGAVGEAMALALRAKGWAVTGTLRRERAEATQRLADAGVATAWLDLGTPAPLTDIAADADAILFAPNLGIVAPALPLLAQSPARILAVSSNNVAIDPDAPAYRALAEVERALFAFRANAIALRPTLIYGDPRLPTAVELMRLARARPLMPVPGSGRAMVQPLFHRDLAAVAAGLLDHAAVGGVYAVGGPDIVPMRDFYRACARAARARTLVTPIPVWALRRARQFGMALPLDDAQLARADLDRRACPQAPLPAALAPRTPLEAGLNELAVALGHFTGLGS